MQIRTDRNYTGLRQLKKLVWTTIAAAAVLISIPAVARAQVTAYAVIPSWTQSKVLIKDAHTGAAIASIPLAGEPYDAAVTADGRRAYVTLRASNQVAVIDLGTLQVETTIAVRLEPRGVVIAPNDTRAWITEAGSHTVSAIDLATNSVIGAPIPVGAMPWGIAVRPQGDRLYVVNRASSTVSAIDLLTQTVVAVMPVDQEPVEIIITPDGRHVLVGTQTNTLRIIDASSHVLLSTIPVGGQALRVTSTLSMVVPDSGGGMLSIANDADLKPFGFGGYITFRGGVLRATNDFFTSRHLSLLPQGGTIATQNFTVEIAGSTVNDGTLAKRGTGTLRLTGNITHTSTHALQGTLAVLGTHLGSVRISTDGTLAGTGTVVYVDASRGTISPGVNAPGDLYAGDVVMSPSHTLVMEINGVTPGSQYDRLIASGSVSINGATLSVVPGGLMPKGATFTIVTNANGQFAGLPEGAIITTVLGTFRISYMGGPAQTDVVLKAL